MVQDSAAQHAQQGPPACSILSMSAMNSVDFWGSPYIPPTYLQQQRKCACIVCAEAVLAAVAVRRRARVRVQMP